MESRASRLASRFRPGPAWVSDLPPSSSRQRAFSCSPRRASSPSTTTCASSFRSCPTTARRSLSETSFSTRAACLTTSTCCTWPARGRRTSSQTKKRCTCCRSKRLSSFLCNLADASAGTLARQVAEIYLEKRLSPERPANEVPPIATSGLPDWLSGSEKLYWSRETGRVATIAAKHGALEYGTDDQKVELVPTAADRWQSRDGSLTITLRDAAKEIQVASLGSDPVVFQAVDRWSPMPSELASYQGRYWCREL